MSTTDNVETSTSFFGSQAERWADLYESSNQFCDRAALFCRQLAGLVSAPARILDFGCGTGYIAIRLAEAGYTVTGIDGSESMVEAARVTSAKHRGVDIEFTVRSAESLELKSGEYHAIICSSVLEYVQDELGLLLEFAHSIRPDGYLLISVPDRWAFKGLAEDCLKHMPGYCNADSRRHLLFSRRRYSSRHFIALAAKAGFNWIGMRRFENPLPGRIGVCASRLPFLGTMLLVILRYSPATAARAFAHRLRAPGALPTRQLLWDLTPRRLRSMAGRIAGELKPEVLLGGRFADQVRACKQAERWSLSRFKAYQLQRVREICALAQEKSSFYASWFRQHGLEAYDLKSLEDFSRFPTIDAKTIRDHGMDMVVQTSERAVEVSTGGTGGRPLMFRMSAGRSATEYAYLTTSWNRAGFDPAVSLAVFRGRTVDPGCNGLRHEYDPILRHHYYSNFHMTAANMSRYLEHIRTIGPCFLHVYPSSVYALARFIRSSGIIVPRNIQGIIAESEIVYPEQRTIVEEIFACRYFSCYGHSEKLVLAAECEHSADYHVWPTYGYFELLNEEGHPITTPGKRGEIVGTGFINTVMPFIRYRTGDYATYVGDRCEACGRHHPIIRDIRGHRTQEYLVAADGSEISWTALNMHDETFLHVRQFQFTQDTPGRAVLGIVPDAAFDDNCRARIRQKLGRKLDGRLELEVQIIDSIPLSARGKALYVNQRMTTDAELTRSEL